MHQETKIKPRLSRREFIGISSLGIGVGLLTHLYLQWRGIERMQSFQGAILRDHPLLENYIDFIESQRELVDYDQITQNTRAVNFGENHEHFAPKDELTEHMPDFADLGFTHFGTEFFHSDFQPTLDEYFNTGKKKEEVLMHLIRARLGGIVTEYDIADGKGYMQIVEAARKNNLRILGLELAKDQYDERKEEIKQAGDAQRKNELKQIFTDEREESMRSVTAKILEDPRARIINFTGRAHNHRLSTKLEETTGIKATSVDYTGKKKVIYGSLIDYAAVLADLREERFMVKITPEWREKLYSQDPYFGDRNLINDDYLIHLPSEARETSIERFLEVGGEIEGDF